VIDFTHLMFWVIVGHFVGDYLLQSKHMALTKSAPGWRGFCTCLHHCFWYTMAVANVACIAVPGFSPDSRLAIVGMVFLTHFPIDRWGLADKWLKMIHGRQLDEVFKEADTLPKRPDYVADVATRQSFTALVYAVVDNLLHFLLMTAGFAALLRWVV
jgi:hypothetical protein